MNSFDLKKKFKKFNKKLESLINSIMCIICSKLLYPKQSYSIQNNQENCDHINLIYKYNNRLDILTNNVDFKCCATCKTYINQKYSFIHTTIMA